MPRKQGKPAAGAKSAKPLPAGAHSIQARRQRVASASVSAKAKKDTAGATVGKVHETLETVALISETPPHPPRTETPEYARAHHFLVNEKKAGCEVCGVTVDTLSDPKVNIWQATALETHHWPLERSYADACDPVKVHRDYPSVYDRATLMQFVDSPANLKVLCSTHHRSVEHGIHHLLPAQFAVQKYLLDGYLIAATAKDADQVAAKDEQIEQAAGIEQAVDQQIAASVASTPTSTPASAPAAAPVKPSRRRAGKATAPTVALA